MIADLEGPSFISRTVAHGRGPAMLVTQDPNPTYGGLKSRSAAHSSALA
jgi:hypothetical protein